MNILLKKENNTSNSFSMSKRLKSLCFTLKLKVASKLLRPPRLNFRYTVQFKPF